LRAFDLLWKAREYQAPIEIEIQSARGWRITMELLPDSTEQIYVRPKRDVEPAALRQADLLAVYVPPMTGISTGEPVYQPPKQEQLLGLGKPGEIIRNLLVQAHQLPVWDRLQDSIRRLFNCELLPPDASGADIIAEYRALDTATRLDIASAGSGLQQVLMLWPSCIRAPPRCSLWTNRTRTCTSSCRIPFTANCVPSLPPRTRN
jgi:hypothetical protein